MFEPRPHAGHSELPPSFSAASVRDVNAIYWNATNTSTDTAANTGTLLATVCSSFPLAFVQVRFCAW